MLSAGIIGLFAVEHEVRRREVFLADLDSKPLNPLANIPQSRRIHQAERKALDHGVRLDGVARGAGDLGHDCALGTEQRVEQGRFAGVGPACDHEQRAFAQPFALGSGLQEIGYAVTHNAPRISHAFRRDGTLILLGKVDVIGQQRVEFQDLAAERRQAVRQPALELLQRAAALRRRTGVDEVGGRLGLQQIHLAVQHGAASELARHGGPCPGLNQRRDRGGRHDQPAMGRDLDQVIAGVGVRRREAGREAVVHERAGRGM